MSTPPTPRPPLVAGALEAHLGDVPRILWWSQRGFLHGARHGHGAGRVASVLLALMWWPMFPLLMVVQAFLVSRRSARYYMSQERDAVLAIVSSADGWHVSDHIAARPGTGRGMALRELLLPELLAAADDAGIYVHATAATKRLATAYKAGLPDLEDVGRGWPRGRKLIRKPRK